jgi:hypothetical protein
MRALSLVAALLGGSLSTGCGSSGVLADAGVADANPGDVVTDSAADQSSQDPCTPGTCRSSSDSSGPCLPPGGPIGLPDSSASLSGCCACGNDGLCSSPCAYFAGGALIGSTLAKSGLHARHFDGACTLP